jgi:hypothetical protein
MEKISMATTTATTTIAEQHKLVEINSTNTNEINLNTEKNIFDYDKIPLEVNSVRSGTASRTNFKKSITCGSLYANCNCSESTSSSSISNCEKESKKLTHQHRPKNQSFSHPDTPIVFTEENRYPSSAQDSQACIVPDTITVKSGLVEIKPCKRASSPNLSGIWSDLKEVPVHPELQVKIGPRTSADNAKDRSLRRSIKSLPGTSLSSFTQSFDSVGSSRAASVEEENDLELINKAKNCMITDLDDELNVTNKENNNNEIPISFLTCNKFEEPEQENAKFTMGSVSSIAKKTSKIKPIIAEPKFREHVS